MYKRFYPPILSRQTTGTLIIDLQTDVNLFPLAPIPNALVSIKQLLPSGATQTIAEFNSNTVGQTPPLELVTPPVELSLEPQREIKPFSSYFVEVTSTESIPVTVQGVQVFPDILSIQPISLIPTEELTETRQTSVEIEIGLPTLFGDFPPSIPQAELKDVSAPGFITLESVIVPEIVIVHAGSPNNANAPNYSVPFKDYIKNVASSEIYPTWPEQTILANTRAIISFTLNRVYTEWYRNQGKNFTITNSTAFDHAFFYGRNIFDTISVIVDDYFDIYVQRPGNEQPLLTQYCDGVKSQCPNKMTQWGSKSLGDDGLSAEEILRFYYGEDILFPTAPLVQGTPESYPGAPLRLGDSGSDVRKIQEQLNRISQNYPLIPRVRSDGIFNEATEEAVKTFQQIFHLPQTGIVDKGTWYKISEIYVAVTKIAELL